MYTTHNSFSFYCVAVGIVTQDTQLFNATIEGNIAYGLDHYTQEVSNHTCEYSLNL